MSSFKHFRPMLHINDKGRTVRATTVPCRVCTRRTRETGNGDICEQCFDLAGIENEISDGLATPSERADEVRQLITKLMRKNVDMAPWADLMEECGVSL